MRRWAVLLLGVVGTCGGDPPGNGDASSDVATSGTTTAGSSASSNETSTSSASSASSSTNAGTTTTSGDPSETTAASTGAPIDDELVGWASVEGDGVRTTTGGEGGETIVVTTIDELTMYAGAGDPYVIQVSGTIAGVVLVASNKTIEGLPDARLEGGLVIEGEDGEFVSNVIVRNLTVAGVACPGDGCSSTDAITVYRAHHVWIDHCDISDGDDGNLDITEESDYITVSWCRFSYSDASASHRYSNLIGADDAATGDADDLRVTLHHNWWTENVSERMPRVRFGPVHVFNNYYTPADDLYCIRPGVEANLLVENNYFDGAQQPFDAADPTASIAASGNVFVPDPVDEPMQGDVFDPPYSYELDAAEDVPAIVQAGAGPM